MYKTILPNLMLRRYVARFWEGELVIDPGQVHTHHAIANRKLELLFCFAGDYATSDNNGVPMRIPTMGFYGQTNTSKQFASAATVNGFFGVQLYAHALPLLFNIPATVVTNQQIDVVALLERPGAALADKLLHAMSFEERVQIVSGFLEAQLHRGASKYTRLEKLIFSIYESKHYPSISELVKEANLSPRQFERHFKDLTGFSAKTFFKLARFEQLIEVLTGGANTSPQKLTAIAHALDYYDQAHLNRHFREFTGLSPSAFLQQQAIQVQ
ncbi:helix-turn-helix domain-containing protein [Longitalea luteola]|uniref:helix-turn-helix domain-containing protein n=1 Tax=Longitalea luteola TaxID=2812563 RepID=UPI001A97B3CD|nr:helix-turn-helix domain-containing protein [Longitalea luteola]